MQEPCSNLTTQSCFPTRFRGEKKKKKQTTFTESLHLLREWTTEEVSLCMRLKMKLTVLLLPTSWRELRKRGGPRPTTNCKQTTLPPGLCAVLPRCRKNLLKKAGLPEHQPHNLCLNVIPRGMQDCLDRCPFFFFFNILNQKKKRQKQTNQNPPNQTVEFRKINMSDRDSKQSITSPVFVGDEDGFFCCCEGKEGSHECRGVGYLDSFQFYSHKRGS